jgi:polygalacturonase
MPANLSRAHAAVRTGFLLVVFFAVAFASAARAGEAVDLSVVENLRPAPPAIPARVFKLTDYGANGNGQALNTAAFRKAIAAVEKAGGGKLIVPEGIFRTEPFALCSRLELQLEPGAVIRAADAATSPVRSNPSAAKSKNEPVAATVSEPLIRGKNLQDVAITGAGTIDGSGAPRWAQLENNSTDLIAFEDIQRLLVTEITLSNSPRSYLTVRNVSDVALERITVRASADNATAPATALDLSNVTRGSIRSSELATAGEHIGIRSETTSLLIEDCVFSRGTGISFGPDATAGISGVLIRRCTFNDTSGGLRLIASAGVIENVRISELALKNLPTPVLLQLEPHSSARPGTPSGAPENPRIRRIELDRVQITGADTAVILRGAPEHPITDITLRDVTLSAEKDFEIQDADEPTLQRVHTTIVPAKAQP